jgi:apolipoprotein D and lipocalin family protein
MFKSIMLVGFILVTGCAAAQRPAPDTVDYVDLERYMGRWYEIAKYDNSFQKNCLATRATYGLQGSRVRVHNECIDRRSGKLQSATGTAVVKDKQTNAKLKVSFVPYLQRFGLFAGDYWIMALDPEYQYAVIGHPSRKYLWILSRTPQLEANLLTQLIQLAVEQGYNAQQIKMTPPWL